MGMTQNGRALRVYYFEDGVEHSFVTVAKDEAGCRRNLRILRGENARFIRMQETHVRSVNRDIGLSIHHYPEEGGSQSNGGKTTEPATAPEAGARVPGEEEECFEQTVLWD